MIYIKQELLQNEEQWNEWAINMMNCDRVLNPLDDNKRKPERYPCVLVYAEDSRPTTYLGFHFEVSYRFIDESAFGKFGE